MAIGDIVVDVFALAADAVRRVGELLDTGGVDRRVDAEENHRIFKIVVDRRAERIVRVQAERRVRAVADANLDVFQRVRHLAVAVELVAEEVRHHDGLRVNQRMRIAALAEQGGVHGELGGHAAEQVCAGLVGKVRDSSVGPRLLDHTGGRGLAVGARDDHGRHVLCQLAQQIGTELQRDAPGEIRAAAAQQTDRDAGQLAGKHRKKYLQFHAP